MGYCRRAFAARALCYLTMENTLRIDIFCAVPCRETFSVQVKDISEAYVFYIDKIFFEGGTQAQPKKNLLG